MITREDIKSWRYNTSSRNAAGGVLAKSHNAKTGKTEEVLVPDPDNPLALHSHRPPYRVRQGDGRQQGQGHAGCGRA